MADDLSGFTPSNLACGSKCPEAGAVLQSAEGSSRVPDRVAEEQLNLQHTELSDYFAKRYLAGELYYGIGYSKSSVDELLTYKYKASDGAVMVWRHAFDLRAFGKQGEEVVTLYHYTDEVAFLNVGNLEQTAAELFASLVDERAHFGKGLYATQHEPAAWGSRLRILLNNYSNKDPFSPTPEEARKRDAQWGNGRKSGHRAAFCIPLIVPHSIAYNIFERHTPDMAERTVKDSAGQERRIELGEDNKGQPTHPNRDVWVIRVEKDGRVQNAAADADAVLDLLRLRLRKLRTSAGEDLPTAQCMFELARRLQGRALYPEAEELYRKCLAIRKAKLDEDFPDTSAIFNNLAAVFKAQGRLREAEPLFREALEKSRAKLGEDHPNTSAIYNNLAGVLLAQGRLAEAEPLLREALERSELDEDFLGSLSNSSRLLQDQGHLAEAEHFFRLALKISKATMGADHPDTLIIFNNIAANLYQQGRLAEAEPLCREGLEKSKATMGADHPDTLNILNRLALILQDQGRLAEAEHFFREAIKKSRLKLGNQHPTTRIFMVNLAFLLKSMKKFEEAEELFREELLACIAVHGEDHPETVDCMVGLAEFLEERGKMDAAQELLHLAGQTAQRTA